jgi:hypothetical protein
MLWHKGWLETRFRLLVVLGFITAFLAFFYAAGTKPPLSSARQMSGITSLVTAALAMICGMLAGAGINTQPAFQSGKGLHGSTIFTLSLPVSRFRLLAVRASLGWMEMTGVIAILCGGLWAVFPPLRAASTAAGMLGYTGDVIACSSALYSVSVLLATFLEEQWRMIGTLVSFAALSWLSSNAPLPASVNIFRAIEEGSPLLTHAMPWGAMAFSLVLASLLLFASLRIVQRREY